MSNLNFRLSIMKIKLTFLVIFIFYSICFSQIEGRATYEIQRNNDNENRYNNNNKKKEFVAYENKINRYINNQSFLLVFKNGKSHFTKKKQLTSDSENSSLNKVIEALYPDTYFDFKEQKNYIVDYNINKKGFLVALNDDKTDVEYLSENFDEVKQGIICSKAVITYNQKNKVYKTEIWYSKEINLPYGPLSYNRFPGLVVLVKENDGTLIKLKEIDFKSQKEIEIPKLEEVTEDDLEEKYGETMNKLRN